MKAPDREILTSSGRGQTGMCCSLSLTVSKFGTSSLQQNLLDTHLYYYQILISTQTSTMSTKNPNTGEKAANAGQAAGNFIKSGLSKIHVCQ
jgi:hypothetical protein